MKALSHSIRRVRESVLARNAGWSFAGQGLSIVMQAAFFVIIARLMGSTNYGIYTAAFALVSIVSQFSSLGSGYVFLRYVSADRSKFAEYWGNILVTTLSVGSVSVVLLATIGKYFFTGMHASLIIFIAIGDTICQQLISTLGQVFQTYEKLRITAALTVALNAMRLLAALVMYFTMRHADAYQWAAASMAASIAVTIYALFRVTRDYGAPKIKRAVLFGHITEGVAFSVSGSTTSVYNDLDKALLGHFGMNTANGIYTMAYRILNICSTPITSIHNATFPRFFQLGTGGATKTIPFAKQVLKRTVWIGIVAAVGMFATAPLIPHIVGKGFAESASALRWLCLIPLFRCFHLSAGDALAGSGYQNYRLATRVVACVANLGLNLWLIPQYSWLGAAWASLATDGGLGVLDWVTIRWLASNEKHKSTPALELA